MRTAEDNTLIPHVRMGVEAREQVVTKKGSLVKKTGGVMVGRTGDFDFFDGKKTLVEAKEWKMHLSPCQITH